MARVTLAVVSAQSELSMSRTDQEAGTCRAVSLRAFLLAQQIIQMFSC